MKYTLSLLFVFLSLSLFADEWRHYYAPDTLKTPEGKTLSKKERRRQIKEANKQDFSLSAEKRKADNLYQNLGFMEAAEYYENLEEQEMNHFVQSKLANSYRLNGQYEEAEYWYSQMIRETQDPEDYMNYALVLQSNGKCEDAVRWYSEYLKNTMDQNREFITNCEQLEYFKESSDVSIKNMEELNTEHLDFSPIRYKDGIIFTSNRDTKKGVSVNRDKWSKNNFTNIFYAKTDKNGNVKEIKAMDSDINSKYHDGVVTFNKQGNLMIFSRSNKKGRSSEGIKDLKLYSSKHTDNYWEEPVELNINSEEFASCHPTLSLDGRRLYFSSDRKGGYGGMDIWVSEKLGNKWTEPKNLGPSVNTSGQEVFPFIAEDETLYFASNGHRGIGGLDIFAIKKTDEKDETTWSIRENIGRPFNSEKDDFSFVINEDGASGYFSSNRHGGKGGDDVYEWNGAVNAKIAENTRRKICVYDETSGERLPYVDVTIVETASAGSIVEDKGNDVFLTLKPLNNENKEYVLSIASNNNERIDKRNAYQTNKKGIFYYNVNPDKNYVLLVENKKFENYRNNITGADLLSEVEYCLPIKKKTCMLLNGSVVNEAYNSRIPRAKVYLFNKCNGETTEEISDDNGEFNFCLECGCEYEVIGQKQNFSEGRTNVSTIISDCADVVANSIDISLEAVVKLSIGNAPIAINPNMPNAYNNMPYIFATPNRVNGNYPNPYNMSPEELNRYFTGKDTPTYETGQVIKLSNIYYDFDKANIRKDAANELDYVYQLLKTYPSMKLALQSHTDARGKNSYNEKLSKRRAESAMLYLVNKGISPSRLTYEGHGENKLTNDCADGINCDELQHQLNRRTEIRITSFNAPAGVRIQD